jgi:hypothetical protein
MEIHTCFNVLLYSHGILVLSVYYSSVCGYIFFNSVTAHFIQYTFLFNEV